MYCWSNSGKRKSLFQNIVIIHFGNRSCCQGMFFLVRFPDFNQKQQICLNFPEIPIKYVQFPSPSRNWILSYAEAVTKCSCFAIQPIANLQDQSILIRHFGETDIQSHIFKKSKNTWYRLNIFEKLYPFLIFWEIQKQDQERMSTGKQPKNSEFEDFPTCLRRGGGSLSIFYLAAQWQTCLTSPTDGAAQVCLCNVSWDQLKETILNLFWALPLRAFG